MCAGRSGKENAFVFLFAVRRRSAADLGGWWQCAVVLEQADGVGRWPDRDNGHHAQFAIGSALHVAEVAWHQGVDLYAAETQRYTAALELLATQLLTGDMQGTCADSAASESLFDTWEVGYNHYHNRMGIDLPQTSASILAKIRPKAPRAVWNLAYETLTHAGL